MCNRVFQIMVSLVLVLILSSSGVCAILSLHKNDTACQKGKTVDAGFRVTISGLCKIPPCSINQTRIFTLPEISLRRLEEENRSVLNTTGQVSLSEVAGALPDNQMLRAALKIPLSFKPPPIFYLHCTLIC
jgi:hypothetical protein